MTTSKNPEATKRAKAREKVMKQRQDHEAWVEQLAAVCDATNVEKQRLAAEIIFLEHNMDRKKLLRVILRLGRIKMFTGYQTWVNNTIKPDRLKKFAERDRIRAEIEAYYAQIKADEKANEERQQKMLEARLNNTSEAQYQLILKIFGKMTGDKTREAYAHWKGMVLEFQKKYTLMKRILSKLVGSSMMAGWTKWYRRPRGNLSRVRGRSKIFPPPRPLRVAAPPRLVAADSPRRGHGGAAGSAAPPQSPRKTSTPKTYSCEESYFGRRRGRSASSPRRRRDPPELLARNSISAVAAECPRRRRGAAAIRLRGIRHLVVSREIRSRPPPRKVRVVAAAPPQLLQKTSTA